MHGRCTIIMFFSSHIDTPTAYGKQVSIIFRTFLIFNAFFSVSCSRLSSISPFHSEQDVLVWIGNGHKYSPYFYENFSVACRLCVVHAVFYVLFLLSKLEALEARRNNIKANNFVSFLHSQV